MRLWAVGVLVLVYGAGCAVLNENVARACTHGNCIHGWYSANTGSEQALFFMWAIGFPVALVTFYVRHSNRAPNGNQRRYQTQTGRPDPPVPPRASEPPRAPTGRSLKQTKVEGPVGPATGRRPDVADHWRGLTQEGYVYAEIARMYPAHTMEEIRRACAPRPRPLPGVRARAELSLRPLPTPSRYRLWSSDSKCEVLTKSGRRCVRWAPYTRDGRLLCEMHADWQHGGQSHRWATQNQRGGISKCESNTRSGKRCLRWAKFACGDTLFCPAHVAEDVRHGSL